MSVYLAGSLMARNTIALVAQILREQGIDVVSTWHERPGDDMSPPDEQVAALMQNMADLAIADEVVVFTHLPSPNVPKATWLDVGWFLGRHHAGAVMFVYGENPGTAGIWRFHHQARLVQWPGNMGTREFACALAEGLRPF